MRSEQRLSDSYYRENKQIGCDVEAIVHCYDFRMSEEEIKIFLSDGRILPERMCKEQLQLRNSEYLMPYVLFINAIKYNIRCSEKKDSIAIKQEFMKLVTFFREHGYLVEFFADKEVVKMSLENITAREVIEI